MMKKRGQYARLADFGYARNTERGMTLIEVLIALGILTAVAVVFLIGMSVSSKGVIVSQERVAVDSLAKSQLEYIKSLPYDAISIPLVYAVDPAITVPQGYNIAVAAVRLDPENDGTSDDDGLQQITVTITRTRNEQLAFTLVGYKVNR
jgi:prepilin-type N-terminal cleavage/methylation domain-containing protein